MPINRIVPYIALAYALLGAAGLTLAIPPGYASPVFPAAGMALACVLLFGRRALFGIWLGSLLLNLSNAWLLGSLNLATMAVDAAIAGGATAQAWLGAWLINHWKSSDLRDLEREQDVFVFLLLGGILAAFLSSAVGVSAMSAGGIIEAADFFFTWWNWYVGDALGILVFAPLTLCLLSGKSIVWIQRRRHIVFPMMLTMILVLLAFYGTARWENQVQERQLQSDGNSIAKRITDRLITHREVLLSLCHFIEVTPDFSFHQFEQFTLVTLKDNPDIFALSFNDIVTNDQRPAYEKKMTSLSPAGVFQITERNSEGKLVPAATRSEYVAVRYIVPLLSNKPAIGFDINSEPIRRAAIEKAKTSKSMAVTEPIQLVQEEKKRVGLLELQPVIGAGRPKSGDQKDILRGFVVGVIKIDETIEIATRGHIPGGLIFRLTDPLVSPGGKGLLYHSANENLDGSLSKPGANWETQLQMGDRNWILTISATADYRKQHRPWMAWAVGVAGLVFAALLQILMLGMTGRTAVILRKNEEIQDLARNLEEKVAARTSELEESVQSYRNQVAERERAEEGLRQAKATLEQRVEERTKELILLHSRMVMQEKMASVGQLAAGIAHELNNPINFVRTNFASLTDSFTDLSVMLKAYQENMSRIRQDITQTAISDKLTRQAEELNIDYLLTDIPVLLTESETGFQRIATIINSMRDFSRIDKAEDFGWADINNGLEDTLVIARHEYRYHAEIVRKYGDLPEICCMLQQLNQVFLNIIVNCSQAVAAMPAGHKGCITISTRHEGNQIVCQIGDNGPGIPESIQQRIFEPFFTTKEPGKGTGLGLSISYDIVVNKHHGDLQVACPVTGGTVFSIILPIKQKE